MTQQLSPADQARYAALATRMEQDDFGPIDSAPNIEPEPDFEALLEGIDVDETMPTPPPASGAETVSAAEVHSRLGRPGLGGTSSAGRSPKRQVRLPRDLDQLLDQRAAEQHRTPSELMRDAIDSYLHAS